MGYHINGETAHTHTHACIYVCVCMHEFMLIDVKHVCVHVTCKNNFESTDFQKKISVKWK